MKREQVLDFIMTYGWAFIVVLICIAALAYFLPRDAHPAPAQEQRLYVLGTDYGTIQCEKYATFDCGVWASGCYPDNKEYYCLTNVEMIGRYPK